MKALFLMDPALAVSLRPAVEGDGIGVDVSPRASEADMRLQTESYAVILAAHDRLGQPRFSRLRSWRRAGVKGHILVLLPHDGDSMDKVACLDAGADGYLVQPVCAQELKARFRAL